MKKYPRMTGGTSAWRAAALFTVCLILLCACTPPAPAATASPEPASIPTGEPAEPPAPSIKPAPAPFYAPYAYNLAVEYFYWLQNGTEDGDIALYNAQAVQDGVSEWIEFELTYDDPELRKYVKCGLYHGDLNQNTIDRSKLAAEGEFYGGEESAYALYIDGLSAANGIYVLELDIDKINFPAYQLEERAKEVCDWMYGFVADGTTIYIDDAYYVVYRGVDWFEFKVRFDYPGDAEVESQMIRCGVFGGFFTEDMVDESWLLFSDIDGRYAIQIEGLSLGDGDEIIYGLEVDKITV